MIITIIKTILTVIVVCGISAISHRYPKLSGFIATLPTTSLLIVIFSHFQYKDNFNFIKFYKGMLIGLPSVALFYIPFLFIKNFYLALFMAFLIVGLITIIYKYFNLI